MGSFYQYIFCLFFSQSRYELLLNARSPDRVFFVFYHFIILSRPKGAFINFYFCPDFVSFFLFFSFYNLPRLWESIATASKHWYVNQPIFIFHFPCLHGNKQSVHSPSSRHMGRMEQRPSKHFIMVYIPKYMNTLPTAFEIRNFSSRTIYRTCVFSSRRYVPKKNKNTKISSLVYTKEKPMENSFSPRENSWLAVVLVK